MRWLRAALVLVAAGAALAPWPPAAVERFYSTRFYPAWQVRATMFSNRWGFALVDGLLVVVPLVWLLLAARDLGGRKAGWLPPFARIATRTLVWSAALYLLFLLSWGLNYRRVPLVDKLAYDRSAVSPAAARALAATAVGQLNALYDQAHAQGWRTRGAVDDRLADAFAVTERALGARAIARPARPKTSLLDPYFRRVGVDGMTDPFFLETLVARGLLPFERPFVVAHEWSHLAGYADESEANFVGWLTCLRGPAPDQYSGWLFLFGELMRAVPREDRTRDRRASRAGAARRPPRRRRPPDARRQPPPVRGGLAHVRPLSQGEPRRGRRGELRSGRAPRARREVRSPAGCRSCKGPASGVTARIGASPRVAAVVHALEEQPRRRRRETRRRAPRCRRGAPPRRLASRPPRPISTSTPTMRRTIFQRKCDPSIATSTRSPSSTRSSRSTSTSVERAFEPSLPVVLVGGRERLEVAHADEGPRGLAHRSPGRAAP